MPTSFIYEGKVLDWKFVKHTDTSYKFYTGDIFQGYVWKLKNQHWVAIPAEVPKERRWTAYGFNSRHYAAQYILNLRFKE